MDKKLLEQAVLITLSEKFWNVERLRGQDYMDSDKAAFIDALYRNYSKLERIELAKDGN